MFSRIADRGRPAIVGLMLLGLLSSCGGAANAPAPSAPASSGDAAQQLNEATAPANAEIPAATASSAAPPTLQPNQGSSTATIAPPMASPTAEQSVVPSTPTAVLPTEPVTPTSAPAQPTATAALPPAAQGQPSVDQLAAVQAVLDYYTAISQKQLDAAFKLWAKNGAASGQTLDQFKTGYAATAAVNLRLGEPSQAAGAREVTVPAEIVAISNASDAQGMQKVQHFRGSYVVQPSGSGWQLASANIAETAGQALPEQLSEPEKLIAYYYDLIGTHAYAEAYTLWGQNGQNSNQSFVQFAQGFAGTRAVRIELGKLQAGGAAGSIFADLPIVIVATQANGQQQAFCGSYTLRRLNVPPFDQLGWRIERAQIAPTAAVQLDSPQSAALLAGGCQVP